MDLSPRDGVPLVCCAQMGVVSALTERQRKAASASGVIFSSNAADSTHARDGCRLRGNASGFQGELHEGDLNPYEMATLTN